MTISYNPYRKADQGLLGGLAAYISDGGVSVVGLESQMTAHASFENGKCVGLSLPDETALPEGFTLDAVRGLFDHEAAHARFSNFEKSPSLYPCGSAGFHADNLFEDFRIEDLIGRTLQGSGRNIQELRRVGIPRMAGSAPKMTDPYMATLAVTSALLAGFDADTLFAQLPVNVRSQALKLAKDNLGLAQRASTAIDTERMAQVAREWVESVASSLNNPPPPPTPQDKPQPKLGDAKEGTNEQKQGAPGQDSQDEDSQGQPEDGEGDAQDEDGDSQPQEGPGKAPGQDEESEDTQDESEGPQGGSQPQDEDEGEDGEGSQAWDEDEDEDSQGQSQGDEDEDEGSQFDPNAQAPDSPSISAAEVIANELQPNVQDDPSAISDGKLEVSTAGLREALDAPIYATSPSDRSHLRTQVIYPSDRATCSQAVEESRKSLQAQIAGIRTGLRLRILADGRTVTRKEQEEGSLDSSRLWALCGGTSDRVFMDSRRTKTKATLVQLLVDCSGSMGNHGMYQAGLASVALAEALRGLPGVLVEVLGFTSTGLADGVRFSDLGQYARANECNFYEFLKAGSRDASPLAVMLQPRTYGIKVDNKGYTQTLPQGGTPTGEAIRWAVRRGRTIRADRRILMVLTDGSPAVVSQDHRQRFSLPMNVDFQDAKVSINASRRAGVETIGIGISGANVEDLFGKAQSVSLRDATKLAGATLDIMVKALAPKH